MQMKVICTTVPQEPSRCGLGNSTTAVRPSASRSSVRTGTRCQLSGSKPQASSSAGFHHGLPLTGSRKTPRIRNPRLPPKSKCNCPRLSECPIALVLSVLRFGDELQSATRGWEIGMDRYEYAGFWIRVAAYVINSLLLMVMTIPILISIYGVAYLVSGPDDPLFRGLARQAGSHGCDQAAGPRGR